MNRHGRHHIRNGIVWVQTGHSTYTCTATFCVIELRSRQKFDSFEKYNFRDDENRIPILLNISQKNEIVRVGFGRKW